MTQSHDERWLEDLWVDFAARVRAYLQRRVRSDAVDDLLAEVFVVVWRHRAKKPTQTLPWLYGIARKVVATHFRAADRRRSLSDKLAAQPQVQSRNNSEVQARSEIVDALQGLSPKDRELLLLVAWEGLNPQEIAIATGSNSAAVRMRLSRARAKFQNRFVGSEPTISKGATK